MIQLVKALAAKSDDLNLILRTYTVEGENQPLKVIFRPPQVYCVVCVRENIHTHIHTYPKIMIINGK